MNPAKRNSSAPSTTSSAATTSNGSSSSSSCYPTSPKVSRKVSSGMLSADKEGGATHTTDRSSTPQMPRLSFPTKKRKKEETIDDTSSDSQLDEKQHRLERNEREKARSHQISQRFQDLQSLLSEAGIRIPKGTKALVLEAAMDYIEFLHETLNNKIASDDK